MYEDDKVLCKMGMCLKLVTMLGMLPGRVMCCCTEENSNLCIISGVALVNCTEVDMLQ